jgi:uncharacterized protein YjiS (DUF1127 family)
MAASASIPMARERVAITIGFYEMTAMKNKIRFLKLKFRRRAQSVPLDNHLLRDLGLSRVLAEFAGH